MWVATAFAGVLGGNGVGAQEVVDLPAEDLPLPGDLELVYRIGSTEAVAEWEQFSTILGVGFDAAGSLYLLDGTGARAPREASSWTLPAATCGTSDAPARDQASFGSEGN